MNFLQGYKTYILALLLGVVTIVQYLGYITPDVAHVLQGLLGAGAVATVRLAIAGK